MGITIRNHEYLQYKTVSVTDVTMSVITMSAIVHYHECYVVCNHECYSVMVSNHEIVKFSQEYIYFDKDMLTLSLLK